MTLHGNSLLGLKSRLLSLFECVLGWLYTNYRQFSAMILGNREAGLVGFVVKEKEVEMHVSTLIYIRGVDKGGGRGPPSFSPHHEYFIYVFIAYQ